MVTDTTGTPDVIDEDNVSVDVSLSVYVLLCVAFSTLTCWLTDEALMYASGTVAHVTTALRSLTSVINGIVAAT